MAEHIEVWRTAGPELASLADDRQSIGKSTDSDISLADDPRVSRLHAVLERYGGGWSIRDLGSRNGTFVNGERISVERRLRSGDEILVGTTRLVFRSVEPATLTEASTSHLMSLHANATFWSSSVVRCCRAAS